MQRIETRRRSRKAPQKTCSRPNCRALASEIYSAISGAAEVHRALCAPELMRLGDFELATRVIPARHVGGDFVCTVHRGNRVIAVVADLMGKGLSAAMWLTHTVDLVHRAAEFSADLQSMLELLNAELVNSRVGAPLTTALALELDTTTNVLSYSSAGHPPGMLLRSDSVEILPEVVLSWGLSPTPNSSSRDWNSSRETLSSATPTESLKHGIPRKRSLQPRKSSDVCDRPEEAAPAPKPPIC